MDVLIDETSKCAKCCIYCEEKCEYRCELSKECKTENDVFEKDCADAFDD